MKLLIVEDELELQELITKALCGERYVVECVGDYPSALMKIEVYNYDCILLDVMLPGGSGLDLLKKLREQGKQDSVIIISAKDSLDDKITGLDLGADDYLAKPFHMAELVARVRSIIRRKQSNGQNIIELGNIKVYTDEFKVLIDGIQIELSRKEYDILLYFLNRPNRLIDKITLAESVWGDHIDQVDNYDFIYAQIKNLRKKLNEASSEVHIKAVYGVGYRLSIEQD